ncbi:MAG: hypothetical protein IJU44_01085 [Kiritimatiellae bacterium]|nr:hypothetical protein [Kiritimatiellia bacterium]
MKRFSIKNVIIAVLAVLGIVFLALAIDLGNVICKRDASVNTSVEKREVRFYKDGDNWYADIPQHTQQQNQMVAGADALLDTVADGRGKVSVVLSADIATPDEWQMHLHIVEHDKYGATYRVRTAGQPSSRLIWLCNVTHTVFGGEHPTDIYIHSIKAE